MQLECICYQLPHEHNARLSSSHIWIVHLDKGYIINCIIDKSVHFQRIFIYIWCHSSVGLLRFYFVVGLFSVYYGCFNAHFRAAVG